MKIEVLRCFKNDEVVYGEYYVYEDGKKYLCFQNGEDIKILVHWFGKQVADCVTKPTQKVVEAIHRVSEEYLSTELKFESVTLEV